MMLILVPLYRTAVFCNFKADQHHGDESKDQQSCKPVRAGKAHQPHPSDPCTTLHIPLTE